MCGKTGKPMVIFQTVKSKKDINNKTITLVPEVFLSFSPTKTSRQAARTSRQAARKKRVSSSPLRDSFLPLRGLISWKKLRKTSGTRV